MTNNLKMICEMTGLRPSSAYRRYKKFNRGYINLDQLLGDNMGARIFIQTPDGKKTLRQLSEENGLKYNTVCARYKSGVKDFQTLIKPIRHMTAEKKDIKIDGEETTFKEIALKYGLKHDTVAERYRRGLRGNQLIEPIDKKHITSKKKYKAKPLQLWSVPQQKRG